MPLRKVTVELQVSQEPDGFHLAMHLPDGRVFHRNKVFATMTEAQAEIQAIAGRLGDTTEELGGSVAVDSLWLYQ